MKKIITLAFSLLLTSSLLIGQEICNNAIDDDQDGLVDYNDDECSCEGSYILTNDIIPNPSFENLVCDITTTLGQVDCVDGWMQPGGSTPDVLSINAPGLNIFPDVPLPLPDGDNYIGMYDNHPIFPDGSTQGNVESAGSCLNNPILANQNYLLQVDVGFGTGVVTTAFGSYAAPASVELCFYGTPDCNNLPFAGPNDFFPQCPDQDPNNEWDVIGCVSVSGTNEWVTAELPFQTTLNYNAIVLGPACFRDPVQDTSFYWYMDNIQLFEGVPVDVPVTEIDVLQDCEEGYTLSVPEVDGFDIQWLSNSEAIPNATDPFLTIGIDEVNPDHFISVVYEDGMSCKLIDSVYLEALDFTIDIQNGTEIQLAIGEEIQIETTSTNNDVVYAWQPQTGLSCWDCPDPIITATENTTYMLTGIDNNTGCTDHDTILIKINELPICIPILPNVFTPDGDGVNDFFKPINQENCDLIIQKFMIFNRWGAIVYAETNFDLTQNQGWDGRFNGKDHPTDTFVFLLVAQDNEGNEKTYRGDITLIR